MPYSSRDAIRHTAVIPIAGDQITNDIAVAFRTPTQSAEEIKIKYGCALRQLADPKDIVEVPGVDGREPRQLSLQTLAEVIEPRVVELYDLVLGELRRSGMEEMIASGIVITGGSSRDARHGGTGRRNFSYAGAAGYAALCRRPVRSGQQSALCHRCRAWC